MVGVMDFRVSGWGPSGRFIELVLLELHLLLLFDLLELNLKEYNFNQQIKKER